MDCQPVIDGALADLPDLLARSADAVLIPWQGWSLTTEDYLTTRLMEMVVHSDDLAASVGVPTPEFPEDVLGPSSGCSPAWLRGATGRWPWSAP